MISTQTCRTTVSRPACFRFLVVQLALGLAVAAPFNASAQAQKPATPAVPAAVATVNGKPISAQRLDDVVNQLSSQGRADTPELRAAIRDQLIIREIFAQEA